MFPLCVVEGGVVYKKKESGLLRSLTSETDFISPTSIDIHRMQTSSQLA
jgi:hypothetical protein